MKDENTWFAEWFDSPYYHLLYRNRSDAEANAFVARLTEYMQLESGARVMDLACGKGRHAHALSQQGYEVTGLDLAPQSIAAAKERFPDVEFVVGDMRDFSLDVAFDAVFNLFTSFGYFDRESDNLRVVENVARHLKPGGRLVIDFLHAPRVVSQLVSSEEKTLDGVHFAIRREVLGGHIYKHIEVHDQAFRRTFTERVQALYPATFNELMEKAGFRVDQTFGNYDLQALTPESPRFIIIATKLH